EGGMVVTNDRALAERVRVLRDHGMEPGRRYWHPVLGFNYRLTNLQAALGVAQLEKLDEILAAKRRVAERYAAGLRDRPGTLLPPRSTESSKPSRRSRESQRPLRERPTGARAPRPAPSPGRPRRRRLCVRPRPAQPEPLPDAFRIRAARHPHL